MAEDSAADYFKEDYSAIIADIAAEAGREAALKAREEEQQQALNLTDEDIKKVTLLNNFRVGSENFLTGIMEIKAFVLLLFACLSIFVIGIAGALYYIDKKSDDYYDNFYKAKYEKDLADYKTQLNGVASWAMTNIGMEARAMDMTGVLQDLIHCKLKGFAKKGGKCSAKKQGASFLIP